MKYIQYSRKHFLNTLVVCKVPAVLEANSCKIFNCKYRYKTEQLLMIHSFSGAIASYFMIKFTVFLLVQFILKTPSTKAAIQSICTLIKCTQSTTRTSTTTPFNPSCWCCSYSRHFSMSECCSSGIRNFLNEHRCSGPTFQLNSGAFRGGRLTSRTGPADVFIKHLTTFSIIILSAITIGGGQWRLVRDLLRDELK